MPALTNAKQEKAACRTSPPGWKGFSLLELLIVLAVLSIISAIAIPAFSSIYGECSVKAATWEIVDMIKEAKQKALDERYYAVSFNPAKEKIALLSGRGGDGEWNTDDDNVVRSFRLAEKGGSLHFGYGSYGPVPGLATTDDGITFQTNNTAVCNPGLTGNAGTVYIHSDYGAAMAITVNSVDFGYTLRRWNGSQWIKL